MTVNEIDSVLVGFQTRLINLVTERPFRFENTRRVDANAYLRRLTEFVGLSDVEIVRTESELEVQLPLSYKRFMHRFGMNAGNLFCGSDADPRRLSEYRRWAFELTAENGVKSFLGSKNVVFHFHQGYTFCYFEAAGGDDTAIYNYLEGKPEPQQIAEGFLPFLEEEIRMMEQVNMEVRDGGGYFLQLGGGTAKQVWDSRRAVDRGDHFID